MNTKSNMLSPLKSLISKKTLNEKISTKNQALFLTMIILICAVLNTITTTATFSKIQAFFSNIFGLPIILIIISTLLHVLITGISQKKKEYLKSTLTISTHLISFILVTNIINLISIFSQINLILLMLIFSIYYIINLTFNLKDYYNVSFNTVISVNIIMFLILTSITLISLLNLLLKQFS